MINNIEKKRSNTRPYLEDTRYVEAKQAIIQSMWKEFPGEAPIAEKRQMIEHILNVDLDNKFLAAVNDKDLRNDFKSKSLVEGYMAYAQDLNILSVEDLAKLVHPKDELEIKGEEGIAQKAENTERGKES